MTEVVCANLKDSHNLSWTIVIFNVSEQNTFGVVRGLAAVRRQRYRVRQMLPHPSLLGSVVKVGQV